MSLLCLNVIYFLNLKLMFPLNQCTKGPFQGQQFDCFCVDALFMFALTE